jgi:hypothetical protein
MEGTGPYDDGLVSRAAARQLSYVWLPALLMKMKPNRWNVEHFE